MDVELLVVPHCPNEVLAYDLTRAALAELNLRAYVTTTFLVNGLDPFAVPGAAVGVACRLYRTPTGLAGVPSLDELREALRRASRA